MKLILTRGLPGSGKTTLATKMVMESDGTLMRVNRDDLRRMLFPNPFKEAGYEHSGAKEAMVTAVQKDAIKALLSKGYDVICDDTNLNSKTVRSLTSVAKSNGAEIEIIDLTDMPLEKVLAQNANREKYIVPEYVIINMHEKLEKEA